jgi:hypothetical protein
LPWQCWRVLFLSEVAQSGELGLCHNIMLLNIIVARVEPGSKIRKLNMKIRNWKIYPQEDSEVVTGSPHLG